MSIPLGIRKFGILSTVLLALLLSLAWGIYRIVKLEEKIGTEVTNALWAIDQVEVEYLRFVTTLERYRSVGNEVTRDELQQRFEILWSRLSIVRDGAQSAAVRPVDGVVELIDRLERTLTAVETEVFTLSPGDAAAYRSIRQQLDPLAAPLHEAIVRTYHSRPWRNSYREARNSSARLQIGLAFLGVLLSGGALIFLLVCEIRQTGRHLAATLEAHKALRESETRKAQILHIAPQAIISTDGKQIIRIFNRGAEELFGYAAGEVIGRHLDLLVPPTLRSAHRRHVEDFLTAPEKSRFMSRRGEIIGLRSDGSEFPAEASISRLTLGEEVVLTVMMNDITARKEREREIREAKVMAESANRAKSEFLANMSHELRTPLNAVIGFADIIGSEILGPVGVAKYRAYAQIIRDSGVYLLDLINDILDLSKIEAGKFELHEEEVQIGEAVRACLRMIGERASANGITIVSNDRERPDLSLRVDPRKLKQILINLLTNAVKFTPAGGTVTVWTGQQADGSFLIQVADTGIGIAREDIAKVLERFMQADGSLNRKSEGIGIGLPLTKALVELHGGTLALESEPGAGTTVTVCLPSERVLPLTTEMAALAPADHTVH